MSRIFGQILRLTGLCVEMLGLGALGLGDRAAGGEANSFLPLTGRTLAIIIGAGFALWLIGTTLIYWPRRAIPPRKPAAPDESQVLA